MRNRPNQHPPGKLRARLSYPVILPHAAVLIALTACQSSFITVTTRRAPDSLSIPILPASPVSTPQPLPEPLPPMAPPDAAGRVVWDGPVSDMAITLTDAGTGQVLATKRTDAAGRFALPVADATAASRILLVSATYGERSLFALLATDPVPTTVELTLATTVAAKKMGPVISDVAASQSGTAAAANRRHALLDALQIFTDRITKHLMTAAIDPKALTDHAAIESVANSLAGSPDLAPGLANLVEQGHRVLLANVKEGGRVVWPSPWNAGQMQIAAPALTRTGYDTLRVSYTGTSEDLAVPAEAFTMPDGQSAHLAAVARTLHNVPYRSPASGGGPVAAVPPPAATVFAVGNTPLDVKADAAGNAWVANFGSNNVTKLSPAGAPVGTYATGAGPGAVAIDAGSNVWVANFSGNSLTKLATNGNLVGTYPLPANSMPTELAIDTAGNVWTANQNGDTISKVSPAGAVLGTFAAGDWPIAITVDGGNNVWVANQSSHTVMKFDTNGVQQGTFPCGTFPKSVAVDPGGNIWVLNANVGSMNAADTLTKLSAAGAILNTYPLPNTSVRLTISTTGDLWVTGWSTNLLMKYDMAGNQLTTYLTGTNPNRLTIDTARNVAWVTNTGGNNVARIAI
jgi:streptogramin lyase